MARRRGARRTARRTSRRTTHRVMRRTRRRIRRRTIMVGGFMLLAAGGTYAAVKLSQKDAQRIEEHTGLPPDQLEDQDLEQAMQELNIQSQPLTAEDQATLGSAPPAPKNPPASDSSYLDELEKLAELRDKGILTEDEFEAKKKDLLGL